MVLIVGMVLLAAIAPASGSARDPALMAVEREKVGCHLDGEFFSAAERAIVRAPLNALPDASTVIGTDAHRRASETTQPRGGKTQLDAPRKSLAVPRTEPAR